MTGMSMKGVIDMHIHTNPDLRLRAYDDFELCDAAVRVGARAIVIKTHLGYTANRAYLTNRSGAENPLDLRSVLRDRPAKRKSDRYGSVLSGRRNIRRT